MVSSSQLILLGLTDHFIRTTMWGSPHHLVKLLRSVVLTRSSGDHHRIRCAQEIISHGHKLCSQDDLLVMTSSWDHNLVHAIMKPECLDIGAP